MRPSYITEAEANQVLADFPYMFKEYGNFDDVDNIDALLSHATLIIDTNFEFKGNKYNSDQELEFPRDITGLNVPSEIKHFTVYIALQFLKNSSIFTENEYTRGSPQIKRKKLDVLETEYFEASSVKKTLSNILNPLFMNIIKPFLKKSNAFQVKIERG